MAERKKVFLIEPKEVPRGCWLSVTLLRCFLISSRHAWMWGKFKSVFKQSMGAIKIKVHHIKVNHRLVLFSFLWFISDLLPAFGPGNCWYRVDGGLSDCLIAESKIRSTLIKAIWMWEERKCFLKSLVRWGWRQPVMLMHVLGFVSHQKE